jgi:hypothetical protein
MSIEGQPESPDPVKLAAIRYDLSSAFSAGDDSDGEDFDLDSFRARRLAERETDAQSEPEGNHIEQNQGGSLSPQFAIRRSADVVILDNATTSEPISPFAMARHEISIETPSTSSTSSSDTALTKGSHVEDGDEEPASPYPHLRSGVSNERDEDVDPDIPTQSFEDISLEEDEDGVVTPTSARSPRSGARSPQSAGFHTSQQGDANILRNRGLPIASSTSPGATSGTTTASPAFTAQFKKTKKTGGRSALQKVISKTRPTYLPPKPKEEDVKHLKVWEDMMKKSKQAGEPAAHPCLCFTNGMLLKEEKRKQGLHRRREAHEKEVEESIPRWQEEVLPDWRRVLREPSLRELWWRGIPPKLRGQLWEKAVGNPLQIDKGRCRIRFTHGNLTLVSLEFQMHLRRA